MAAPPPRGSSVGRRRRLTLRGGGGSFCAVSIHCGADDGFDVLRVDTERLADMNSPYLRPQVVLEVEVAAEVRSSGLPVLAHHDEGGEEDRFEADHHRQQTERELVEFERRAAQ